MTPKIIFLWLVVFQHFPPPPPPSGFDLQSFIVTDSLGVERDYGVRNGLFDALLKGNRELGDNLSGFCDVWDNIGGRITNLNRNNWRRIILYVQMEGTQNCPSGTVTVGVACDRARDEGMQVYNAPKWCRGSYDLPIQNELALFLILSFVLILFPKYQTDEVNMN